MTIKPEKTVWDNSWGKQSEVVKISSADRKFFKYLVNEVNPKDKEVLELGCGRAALSYLFSEYGPKSITLVDFSKEILQLQLHIVLHQTPHHYKLLTMGYT